MKNIKRLSTNALAITTASTLILGLAACGNDDDSASGTDENGIDSSGVVKIDDTDSGIDLGPVTNPLNPGEKVTFTVNDKDYKDKTFALRVDDITQKGNKLCFNIITNVEHTTDPQWSDLSKLNDPETGEDFKADLDSEVNMSAADISPDVYTGKKPTSDETTRINVINGGRISERLAYTSENHGVVSRESDTAPYLREELHSLCVDNPDGKKINIRNTSMFDIPDVVDIVDGGKTGYESEAEYTLLDHQDSTGWVIDPQ